MEILLKSNFRIMGMLNIQDCVSFLIPQNEFMEVKVNPDRIVSCFHRVNISEMLFDNLNKESNFSKLPIENKEEIIRLLIEMENATYHVIDLIKFSLNENIFSDHNINFQSLNWRELSGEWNIVTKIRKIIKSGHSYNPLPLTKDNAKVIQENLDKKIEPLVGLRHLHKAKMEENPRFMWIEATIAAELAIKEFLIKFKPELECILLELPSPPLTKLYGSVLEAYIGERYSDLKVLSKGIEIRNKLVHKPSNEEIDYKAAINYVDEIEKAIFFLLKKLYPDNALIDCIVNPPFRIETKESYIEENQEEVK